MSDWSEEGVLEALASRDKNRIAEAKKVLRDWLSSTDPYKREAATRISAKVLDAGIRYEEQQTNDNRKAEIFQTFFRAHPEISDNTANRNLLESFCASNGGIITLDVLEVGVEQLSGSLAKQHVEVTPLTPEQKLRAKLNAQRMRETWLRSLSTEELRKVARDEEQARKHGQDPNRDLRLTQDEKELLDSRPKPSATATRLWNPETSSPRREYNRAELLKLDARTIRRLISTPGGLNVQAQTRFNEILSGSEPEVQV